MFDDCLKFVSEHPDNALTISGWPAVSAYWTVNTADSCEDFRIEMNLSFDANLYFGPDIDNADKIKYALDKHSEILTQLDGSSIYFKTSLLAEIVDVSLELDDLVKWIKGIHDFLSNPRNNKDLTDSIMLSSQTHKKNINTNQLFKLDFEFVMKAPNESAYEDNSGMDGVGEFSMGITPIIQKTSEIGSTGFEKFTEDIENTLSETDQFVITVGLETKQDATLTFLVEFQAQIKSSTDGSFPDVGCDLCYKVSGIELQLSDVNNIKESLKSCSVLFISPRIIESLKVDLGKFDIPILMQTLPETANMVLQSCYFDEKGLDFLNWRYAVAYSQNLYYPQDVLHVEVSYNTGNRNLSPEYMSDLSVIEPLAQFINTRDTLEKLLKEILPQITEDSEEVKIEEAAKAIGAYLKTIKDVADAVKISDFTNPIEFPKQENTAEADEKFYKCTIKEGEEQYTVEKNGNIITAKCWVVRIAQIEANFKLNDIPYLSIEGYAPELFENTGTTFAYRYHLENSENTLLTADDAQAIKKRTLVMPGTSIFEFKNANSYISVGRNGMEKIRSEFVYQTSEVTFPNPIYPKIERDDEIEISQIGTGVNLCRPLREHLGDLFECVSNNTEGNYWITMSCEYKYSINNSLGPAVVIPILLITPSIFEAKKDCFSENKFVMDLSDKISEWFKANHPSIESAELFFDLAVMSDITGSLMPVIRLSSLILDVQEIADL